MSGGSLFYLRQSRIHISTRQEWNFFQFMTFEAWTLKLKGENKLLAIEMKFFQKTCAHPERRMEVPR